MTLRLRSAVLLVLLAVFAVPGIAFGQEPASQPVPSRISFALPAYTPVSSARPDAAAPPVERSRPSILMTSLYASTALMQGLDAHSTMTALHAGATERNPVMSYLTGHPRAFVAMKAGAAAGLIFASNRLAKRNRKQAVIAMIAVNSAYLFVATHNYRVANKLR